MTATLTTLATFDVSNGDVPAGSLIADANGDLFETTERGGGISGFGTVFELQPNGSGGYTTTTLVSFTGPNGADPEGSVIADAAGDLFGTTSEGGGARGQGTVFELTPNGNGGYTYTTLTVFTGANGADPEGSLIADAAGDLFGTTESGGSSNDGTVFELTPNGSGGYTVHLMVDGTRLDGQRLDEDVYAFALPAGCKTVRIASRAAAQDEAGRNRDPSRLGVALRQIVLWQARDVTIVEAGDPAQREGFHQHEAELGCIWTNGDAAIPASVLEHGQRAPRLYPHVGHTAHYPLTRHPPASPHW